METTEPRNANEGSTSTPENGAADSREKKPRVFWRRTRHVTAWLLLIFLFLVFAGALFIQLPVFKRLVVNQLTSAIENSTNSTLTVGGIQGNLLEGFVMNDVTLRLRTGTKYDSIPLVHVDRILASYSLLRWLRTNEIGITSMVLQKPVIRLVKFTGDTTWNFNLLTKVVPAAPNGPPKPFTQIIDVTHFKIDNGSFYMRDYNGDTIKPAATATNRTHTISTANEPAINWANIEVGNIGLDARFYAHGSAMQSFKINHLQFTEKKSGFALNHLQLSGVLDSSQAQMRDVKIISGHSAIGLSIDVEHPQVIATGKVASMQHSRVSVNLNGTVISTAELKQFLPKPLNFLSGSPGIDLNATGEFGKLHIKKLDLNFRNRGTIALSGELDNLHHPDSLTMNIGLRANNLSNATLDGYVPGLHLPDLSRFGAITISSLQYAGAPLNFHSTFNVKTSGGGDATGDVFLDLRNRHIQYRAGLKTTNFNVAALAHDPDFESSLSAETQVAGHGTNWKTMESTISAKTDAPSSFGTYHVSSLDLSGAIRDGTITTDHLNGVVENGPEIHVESAMLGLSSPALPFQFKGTIKNFLLGQVITSQSNNPARVDIDANIAGNAKEFENVTGTAHIRLFNLEYNGQTIPDDTANISMTNVGLNDHKLSVQSPLVDLMINRRFQMGDLLHSIPAHLDTLLRAIKNQDFPQPGETPSQASICPDSIDFDYHVQIKDLRPLVDFLPQTFLLAHGMISGRVNGCPMGDLNLTAKGDSLEFILRERLSLDSNLVELPDTSSPEMDTSKFSLDSSNAVAHRKFLLPAMHRRDSSALTLPKFGTGIPRIQLMPTRFQLELRNLTLEPKMVLNRLDASLAFSTDSVLRLGSALLYFPKVDLTYKNEGLDFSISSLYNNAIGIHVSGDAHVPNGNFDFVLDSMDFTYRNPYFTPANGTLRTFTWRNEKPSHILLTPNGLLHVDTLIIVHPLTNDTSRSSAIAQRMSLGGTLHNDSVNAWVDLPSFWLNDLKKMLPFNPNAKTFDFAKYQGKVRDFRATLGGTLERPDIGARLFVDSMNYGGGEENEITFDSNYLDLSYRDQELRGTMDLHVANIVANAPKGVNPNNLKGSELRATIDSIPMVIAFERGPDYAADSAIAANRLLSASIRAVDFPLDIATPFLPPFRQIDGTGDINFTITGTREHIQYAGQASIQNGAFLLAATNMWFLFGGPITFAHNALVLQNDSIRNISADDPSGSASLNGSFTFNGFDITNFDLRLRSDRLMVLSEAAKEALPLAYGPVTINTGGEDFHFRNTFEEPWINGIINIMSANVTMPQLNSGPQSTSGEDIIYETLPRDTSLAAIDDSIHLHGQLNFSADSGSIQMSTTNDTLFPNWMKNIYRNEDGTVEGPSPEANEPTAPNANPLAPTFVDKLRMDLRVNTQGNATITFPFGSGAFGLLGTQLKADLKSGGTLQIERDDDLKTRANGAFDLSPNSTFTFIQTFNITKGYVTFTNDIANPTFDITAEYIGPHHPVGGAPDNAKIELRVSGSKDHPMIAASLYEQPSGGDFVQHYEPTPEEAVDDAIYFLGTGGYFKSDQSNNGPALGNMLQNLAGPLAANFLPNLAGSTSSQLALRSASFNIGTRGAQVTGAYRDILLKLGSGYSYTPSGALGNYGFNIETDIPLSEIWSNPFARPFMVELQYNPSTTPLPGSAIQQPIFLSTLVWTGLTDLLHW